MQPLVEVDGGNARERCVGRCLLDILCCSGAGHIVCRVALSSRLQICARSGAERACLKASRGQPLWKRRIYNALPRPLARQGVGTERNASLARQLGLLVTAGNDSIPVALRGKLKGRDRATRRNSKLQETVHGTAPLGTASTWGMQNMTAVALHTPMSLLRAAHLPSIRELMEERVHD